LYFALVEIGQLMREKKDASELLKKKADVEAEQATILQTKNEAEEKLNEKLGQIGNLVHDSVVDSNNEVSTFFITLQIWFFFCLLHSCYFINGIIANERI
jgi:seryl-tRNA synthetase